MLALFPFLLTRYFQKGPTNNLRAINTNFYNQPLQNHLLKPADGHCPCSLWLLPPPHRAALTLHSLLSLLSVLSEALLSPSFTLSWLSPFMCLFRNSSLRHSNDGVPHRSPIFHFTNPRIISFKLSNNNLNLSAHAQLCRQWLCFGSSVTTLNLNLHFPH